MALSFNNLVNDLGGSIINGLSTSITGDADNIDDAIKILTSENYSQLYSTYEEAISTLKVESGTHIGANESYTGQTELVAWDPRLARIDGFTVNKSGNLQSFVPFASSTAAGAFYDLVFTTELKVDKEAQKLSAEYAESVQSAGGADLTTSDNWSSNSGAYNENGKAGIADTEENIQDTEKIWRAKKGVEATITKSGNSYGVASIVNPYTLTQLCGSLVVGSSSKNGGTFENYMYDVRDQRRFYGDVIDTNTQDVLTVSNPTTTNIITWSNKDHWGRTPYFFQDFVFCKWWNIIPNNRLITFRKYHAPVYDNLQFSSMFTSDGQPSKTAFAPIATVITYFGDDTGNTLSSLFSFTTGTKWKDINAEIHQVTGETGSDPRAVIDDMFANGGGFPTGESNIASNLIGGANFVTGKMLSFGKFVGLLSPDGYNINKDQAYFDKISQANVDPSEQLYSNKILGPVNRIDTTKARDAGITFDQKISLVCQYVARPIGGVNTKAAMLDILSNCMEMASTDAMFWGGGYRFNINPHMYPFKNTAFKNRIMDDLYAGRIFGKNGALAHTVEGVKKFGTTDSDGNETGFDWANITGKMGLFLGETLGALGELLNSVSNMIFGSNSGLGDWLKGAGDTVGGDGAANKGAKMAAALGSNLNQMWRSQVVQRSIMPNVQGMKALLTGEPVGNWHLTVGNPLNPIMVIGNLICTDMKVEAGEELGPDDFPMEIKVTYTIEHAMPRDKAGIQSMFNRGNGKIYKLPDWIRASSDYESKVDNYTGGTNFYKPSYISKAAMLSQGGGGGFQSYRMPQGTTPTVNTHTDQTVIAKFTPVAVDAAISNIKEGLTFFGANVGARAIIRGTAVTRKLMN